MASWRWFRLWFWFDIWLTFSDRIRIFGFRLEIRTDPVQISDPIRFGIPTRCKALVRTDSDSATHLNGRCHNQTGPFPQKPNGRIYRGFEVLISAENRQFVATGLRTEPGKTVEVEVSDEKEYETATTEVKKREATLKIKASQLEQRNSG